jgi:hypothetical protein
VLCIESHWAITHGDSSFYCYVDKHVLEVVTFCNCAKDSVNNVDRMCVVTLLQETLLWLTILLCSMLNIAAVNTLVMYINWKSIGSRRLLRSLLQQLVQEQFKQCPASQIAQGVGHQVIAVAGKNEENFLQRLTKDDISCAQRTERKLMLLWYSAHIVLVVFWKKSVWTETLNWFLLSMLGG